MFFGGSLTTLHKVFTSAVLSQKCYDSIEQDFLLCNVVYSQLDNVVQDFYQCNVVPKILRQY